MYKVFAWDFFKSEPIKSDGMNKFTDLESARIKAMEISKSYCQDEDVKVYDFESHKAFMTESDFGAILLKPKKDN